MDYSSQHNKQQKLHHQHGHIINRNITPNASIIINLFECRYTPSKESNADYSHHKIKSMKNIQKRSLKIEFGSAKRNKNEHFISNCAKENLNNDPSEIENKNISTTNVPPNEIISNDHITKFTVKKRGRPVKNMKSKI